MPCSLSDIYLNNLNRVAGSLSLGERQNKEEEEEEGKLCVNRAVTHILKGTLF